MSKNGIAIKIEGLFWDYNVVNWRFTYSQAGTLCGKESVVKVEFF